MDLNYTPEEESFRAEVRAFLSAELPADIRDKVNLGRRLRKDDLVRWQKILYRRGWGAGMWPTRFGGAGWSVVEQHIFDEEGAAIGAPPQIPFALRMVAPVLMTFGNAAQQEYYLPRIISGQDWWCQGYSEPGSGSDLASLRKLGDVTYLLGFSCASSFTRAFRRWAGRSPSDWRGHKEVA